MVHFAAVLATLLIMGGALAVIALTLRESFDKVMRALAGASPYPDKRAYPVRRSVFSPRVRVATSMPLRAAA